MCFRHIFQGVFDTLCYNTVKRHIVIIGQFLNCFNEFLCKRRVFLQDVLRTGREEGGFCIVSNYRFYMKGMFYLKKGKHFWKRKQAEIVGLSELRQCEMIIGHRWLRNIPMMQFVCDKQTLAMEIEGCSEYECQKFLKHMRMVIAYGKRQD